MRPGIRHLILAVVAIGVAVLILRTQAPPPEEPPAIELNRAAEASFFETPNRGVLNILVIGSDVREGDPRAGRADTLQLMTMNTKTGNGTIVGIPRDSYVPIPGSGVNKINAALFFGGPDRMVQTVEQLSGINIHYYALIEFSRFRKLVDMLGGVTVNVPYKMADSASGAFFDPGKRKMNGEQALAFSRARKSVPGGDFGRSANQGRLLLAALDKFRVDAQSPVKVGKYLRVFRSLVVSDVPTTELLDLARIGTRLRPWKIRNVVLPGSPGTAGGASVVNLGPAANDMFRKVKDDGLL